MTAKTTTIVAVAMALLTATLPTHNAVAKSATKVTDKGNKFTLKATVLGLAVGDTIIIERCNPPTWSELQSDSLVVTRPDEFIFEGRHPSAAAYSVSLSQGPNATVEVAEADRSATTVLLDRGITLWSSTVQEFYHPTISGPLYEDPKVQHHKQLDDSISIVRSKMLRLMNEAQEQGNKESSNEYADKFSTCVTTEDRDKARQAFKKALDTDTYYALYELLCRAASASDLDQLRTRLAGFSPELQESEMGRTLATFIEKRDAVSVGRDAKAFTVTDLNGTQRTLADYKGRYLLIYNWGLCPGVFQIHKDFSALYEKNREKMALLATTNNIEQIRQFITQLSDTDFVSGIPAKGVLTDMLNGPWSVIETEDKRNSALSDDYILPGTPYYILISPEGKILARGYSEVLDEISEIMEK